MAKTVLKSNQQHKPSETEEVISNSHWKVVAQSLVLIVVYFSLSIGLTFYQRWLLKDFHYPLFVVLTHLMVKLLLAWLCRAIYSWRTAQKRVVLSWTNYVTKVGPTGMASGLDVGFSNWGLALVTVSLKESERESPRWDREWFSTRTMFVEYHTPGVRWERVGGGRIQRNLQARTVELGTTSRRTDTSETSVSYRPNQVVKQQYYLQHGHIV
uniref:Uncharacterized protein n=1 Tax=Timema poppense TaxID=170557 RepID=A0A7R9DA65_TIMPO|nr:unnamed protein product [Timema poppensis]